MPLRHPVQSFSRYSRMPLWLLALIITAGLFILATTGCDAGTDLAEVTLPVAIADDGAASVTTDLGYTITVARARMAVADLAFTIPGDGVASAALVAISPSLGAVVGDIGQPIPPDYKHPGHVSGGVITGELPGPHIIDWTESGAALGTATLLTGDYTGLDFGFRRAAATGTDTGSSPSPDAALASDDPLRGHSVHLVGTAERDGVSIAFEAVLDVDDGTRVYDVPFVHQVRADAESQIALGFDTTDSYSGATLFDGIDFAALDENDTSGTRNDGQLAIIPGSEAANKLRRAVQIHSYYRAAAR